MRRLGNTMSLHTVLMKLLSGIDDPGIRIEVSRAVNYLMYVYQAGSISESDIRRDLIEVCASVIAIKSPSTPTEEFMRRAEACADEILNAFRVETLSRRLASRYRAT